MYGLREKTLKFVWILIQYHHILSIFTLKAIQGPKILHYAILSQLNQDLNDPERFYFEATDQSLTLPDAEFAISFEPPLSTPFKVFGLMFKACYEPVPTPNCKYRLNDFFNYYLINSFIYLLIYSCLLRYHRLATYMLKLK